MDPLNTTTLPRPSESFRSTSYTFYHAGPLFTLAELTSNAALATQIATLSGHRYTAILPQNLEQRSTLPHSIRDTDIRALLASDLALFVYDGAELDSGTVVEYLLAKMADMPCVILRTDFRGAGDQSQSIEDESAGVQADAWNLMSSFWPRTERVSVDGMKVYKECLTEALGRGLEGNEAGLEAGRTMVAKTAEMVIEAFERVRTRESVLPRELREGVYSWLALMPGFRDGMVEANVASMLQLLREKEKRGLLS